MCIVLFKGSYNTLDKNMLIYEEDFLSNSFSFEFYFSYCRVTWPRECFSSFSKNIYQSS